MKLFTNNFEAPTQTHQPTVGKLFFNLNQTVPRRSLQININDVEKKNVRNEQTIGDGALCTSRWPREMKILMPKLLRRRKMEC